MEHFKSPFGVTDFASVRVVENQEFFAGLSVRAKQHRFFSHPFLTAANAFPPSREFASFMLTSIYKLVSPFTSLLCSLGGRAPNLRSRFALMDNIYEEMGCGDLDAAHPNLYLKMLASIGVSADAAEMAPSSPAIWQINEHLRACVERQHFAVGCAVLAASELIIPVCFPAFVALSTGAFPDVDMTFFGRHGPRDEGHSDDAAMLFSTNADRSQFAAVETEVMVHLDYRTDLFDEWMLALPRAATQSRVSERPRPHSAG